ncbi:MAG: sigma 54-interacting transcriptional regulator [Myxococcota bacterium]|nr:sigma 54-interacting transcriptional regulator [Myxococcota bacterium]
MERNPDNRAISEDTDAPREADRWEQGLGTSTRSTTHTASAVQHLRTPGLTLLWHTNPYRIGDIYAFTSLSEVPVHLSRTEPGFEAPLGGSSRALADPHLSRQPIRFSTNEDGAILLDRLDSSTKVEANGVPVETRACFCPNEVEAGVVLLLSKRIVLLLHMMDPPMADVPDMNLIGCSSALVRVKHEIMEVADLSSPVLLCGETGTGKELAAHAIHAMSDRRDKPFYCVNMGAIPPNLAASELFGATRGAYSGADRNRAGFFQNADTGTLFLDEIGETAPENQAALLRVLETGEIQQVGVAKRKKVNVRVIAATDIDLAQSLKVSKFKSPLFYRLASNEIILPPLRNRREDIGRLFLHFVNEALAEGRREALVDPGPEGRPWLAAPLMSRLALGDWPGNVRQLRHVARQLALASPKADRVNFEEKIERLIGSESVHTKS